MTDAKKSALRNTQPGPLTPGVLSLNTQPGPNDHVEFFFVVHVEGGGFAASSGAQKPRPTEGYVRASSYTTAALEFVRIHLPDCVGGSPVFQVWRGGDSTTTRVVLSRVWCAWEPEPRGGVDD